MLRETAHSLRKGASSHSYDRLWPAISSMNQQLGIRNTAGHLEFFLQEFGKELDRFVAEFEIVPNQVGAIILINGRVAGVERAPNPEFWESIWQPLFASVMEVLPSWNPGLLARRGLRKQEWP